MAGLVELRGGKLVLNGVPIRCDHLMPGDVAEMRAGHPQLITRRQQTLPGFVEGATLRFPTLGESCPFRVAAALPATVNAGDIVLMNFDTSGGAQFVRVEADEATALLGAYRRTGRKLEGDINLWERSVNDSGHYTRAGVVDETGLDTFTVDPVGSVDLDDAISVDLAARTVYIHIVDIAGAGASTLHEADEYRMRQYCQTLYLANELTEDLLGDVAAVSLLPGRERAVITTRVRFTEDGLVESYDIYRSRIVSKQRLNYEEFSAVLQTTPMGGWLLALLAARNRDVAYEVNLPSVRIHVDRCDGRVTVSREDTMDPAHRVVAMLMVLCNMIVSRHLRERGVALPNRLHKSLAGIDMTRLPISSGEPAVDSFVLVKRFARACYAIDARGHFGLGLTDYAHFTSPMRRYADVIVHRLLAGWKISREALDTEVEWINWRSGFNKALQQQYVSWKVVAAIAKKLTEGEEGLDVWITGLSAAGALWYAPEYSLNGFCHVSQLLPAQRWVYDGGEGVGVGVEATLVGAETGARFFQMRSRPYRAIISCVNRRMGSVAVRIVCS